MHSFVCTHRRGFTLLEILVVIGILGILVSVTIVAISPRKQLIVAQNAARNNSVTQLQKAMVQYLIEFEVHVAEDGLPYCAEADRLTCAKPICKTTTSASACSAGNGVDFSELVPSYLTALPIDITIDDNDYCTGYMVYLENGRAKVFNPNIGLLDDSNPVDESRCGQSS